MSARIDSNRTTIANWQAASSFDLTVAFEDFRTQEAAQNLFARLQSQLDSSHEIRSTWWALDDLAIARKREVAAAAAASADMIIVSLRSGREIPATMTAWIESWLASKQERRSSLVALFHGPPASAHALKPAQAYLQSVAWLGRMDFFLHCSDSTPELPASLLANRGLEPKVFSQVETECRVQNWSQGPG